MEDAMKHFLCIADLTVDEFEGLLNLAERLKKEYLSGGNKPILAGKTLGMIFQKPSLRTRVSFDMAMLHLGGQALYLSPNEIQLGKREAVSDVARVLSRYVHGIMARVFAYDDVLELARWSSVPVINGLSDYNHPCQAFSDVFTVREKFGTLRGIRLVFVGDGSNNVATSLMFAGAQTGMDIVISAPAGYMPKPETVAKARQLAAHTGASISLIEDPKEAVRGAQVIYTDVWTSMGQEAEAEERQKIFPPYQVNSALVALADPKVIVMHCLPAHRGQEITDEVMDGPHSAVFDQAENRLHAQKALVAHLLGGVPLS
jgi:ornithine carbamoyltransferase